jgi:hypothetical protein
MSDRTLTTWHCERPMIAHNHAALGCPRTVYVNASDLLNVLGQAGHLGTVNLLVSEFGLQDVHADLPAWRRRRLDRTEASADEL